MQATLRGTCSVKRPCEPALASTVAELLVAGSANALSQHRRVRYPHCAAQTTRPQALLCALLSPEALHCTRHASSTMKRAAAASL